MILYHVDKENRVITARFKGGDQTIKDSIHDKYWKIEDEDCAGLYGVLIRNKFKEQNRFHLIGKAVCHEDDTWNEEVGKKLAKKRLLRKYNVLCYEFLLMLKKKIDNGYNKTMNMIDAQINKYKKSKEED